MKEGIEDHRFEQPEVVPHKGNTLIFAFALLVVKEIAAAEEGIVKPEVGIDPVNGSGLFLSVYNDSFVEATLITSEVFEAK